MATLTIHHYLDIIDSFVRNVIDSSKSYYFFVGHPQPWVNLDGEVDDTAILPSNGSVYQHESSVYQDMVYGKLIDDINVSYMIPRYNWISGNVYDNYDQFDGQMYAKPYFVLTDNWDVYKCIDNNNRSVSTVKPAMTSKYGTFTTSDGYTWKYMFHLEDSANTRFTSQKFIPVTQDADVVNNAVGGTIDAIRVANGGRNYRAHYNGYIKSVINSYRVVLDSGAASTHQFYTDSSMYLKSGFGAGQIRKITDYDGIGRIATVHPAFDTFMTFNISDRVGEFNVGDILTQNVDLLFSSYFQGTFNPGDTIIQTDTAANGTIISANTTMVRVLRNGDQLFDVDKAYRNTIDSSQQKSGNSTVVSFAKLKVTSNTGAFTLGETIRQVNSTSQVIAQGILHSANISYSFNPNTSIISTDDFININNNTLEDNDQVIYTVDAGNTAVSTLTNGLTYYVVQSNTNGVKLSDTLGGANLNITATTISETGHRLTLTPLTLTVARSTGQFVVNTTVYTVSGVSSSSTAEIESVSANTEGRKYVYPADAYSNFTADYSTQKYIRVGDDENKNIRRIMAVNSSFITLDKELSANQISKRHYLVPTVAEPISIGYIESNGTISNTNLNGSMLTLTDIPDVSILGVSYITGETVKMLNSINSDQGKTATVSYANSTTVILTDVSSDFDPGYRLYGTSSLQNKYIDVVKSYPTVTISDPLNKFLAGQKVFSRSSADLNVVHGSANVVSFYFIPNELTEYTISPTVTIDGDGENALAYSVVNSSINTTNNISKIVILDPGHGYTHANVSITAYGAYGCGAIGTAVIAPVAGHGSDALSELGAKYVGINMDFDTPTNENYKFPIYGDYRRIGIIQNPTFEDVYVTLDENSFDRATLAIEIDEDNGSADGFEVGEIIIQPNTRFSGVVTFSNTTTIEVKNAKGEFSWDGAYANSTLSNDNIIGMFSNTYANVIQANTNHFTVSPGIEIASETLSGANAVIVTPLSNTYIKLTQVSGRFDAGDTMYDVLSNAYANVTNISVVNGYVDVTSIFGKKFNQTIRIPLTTNTAAFTQFEYVYQENTNAAARVISNNNDFDIKISFPEGYTVGSFTEDNTITDLTTLATAKVIFANSTYIRATAANGVFANNSDIRNNLNITAVAANVFPTLVMSDVAGQNKFQVGNRIHGVTSKAIGNCAMNDVIIYPELTRDSGSVIYLENLENFELANSSKENFKLVIKF